MTSRRGYPLPAVAGTMRGAAAVLGVAAFILTLIATGQHAGRVRTVAVERPVAAERVLHLGATVTSADNPQIGTVQPDVSGALRLFGFEETAPSAPATTHVGRSESRAPLHQWVRPQWGPLTSGFGYRWGRLHAGIDLAGPYGSTIVAATDGCITYAGPESGYGEVMRISDWDGTQTVYGHMSAFLRHSGCVHAGTPIALVGSAGDATGPHLHFEVRIGGVPVNPIPFLAKRGVWV